MKKLIIKILLIFSIFFGFNNNIFAFENFITDFVSYSNGTLTLTTFDNTFSDSIIIPQPDFINCNSSGYITCFSFYLSSNSYIKTNINSNNIISSTTYNGSFYGLFYSSSDTNLFAFSTVSGINNYCFSLTSTGYGVISGGFCDNNSNIGAGLYDIIATDSYHIYGETYIPPLPPVTQICENIINTYQNKFDYNYKEEYNILTDYLDENREGGFFKYGYDDLDFIVSIKNVEGLYGFSGSLINGGVSSFVFNSLDSPLADEPLLKLESTKLNVDYFNLSSTLSGTGTKQYVAGITESGEIVELLNEIGDETNFIFNKDYYFPRNDLKGFIFVFGKDYFISYDLK
ncbi:MAG: hypothetical protein Q9M97_01200 [Candidatus Gracilibacteria bacterium]|nr:hypothetical protein [Candidatus Gracilibacteria bacterium]